MYHSFSLTDQPEELGLADLQERYYRLSEQNSCSIFDLTFCYLSLFLRWAGLAVISLQDLNSVGEGEGGAGSLGNSWLS